MEKKLKTVCITGAGNGIGKATATLMNKSGYNVACCDIDLKSAKDTIDSFSNSDAEAIAIEIDVTKNTEIQNMINEVVNKFDQLDVMVNNAGVTRPAHILELTERDWNWIYDVNAKGTFFCLQMAAKQMIKQQKGGIIINMSSIGAKGFSDVSNAIYASSKGAVLSLTKTAAQQLGKYNINVNSICPSFTYTAIVEDLVKNRAKEQGKSIEELLESYLTDVPIGRINEPEDIAEMVLFLSTERARNITGQSFNIDGGLIPS